MADPSWPQPSPGASASKDSRVREASVEDVVRLTVVQS